MNLGELKIAKELATRIAYKAEQDFDALRRDKIQEATKIIDQELTLLRQEKESLRHQAVEAEVAVENKLVELAQEGNQCKYALGTKLQKSQRKRSGYGYNLTPKTVYGILEVVTRESQFPSNTTSWRRPSPGSLIVRLCTKEGKPGKKFVPWTTYDSSQWKPVESE